MKNSILIIDGYNAIQASSRYKKLIITDQKISDVYMRAREAFINDVSALVSAYHKIFIVFDGGSNPYSEGKTQQRAGLHIIFSPYTKDADEVVELLAKQIQSQGCDITVVSSDAAIQWTVLGDHVTRISSRMFIDELHIVEKETHECMPTYQKHTVKDRINPKVRAQLEALMRGESLD